MPAPEPWPLRHLVLRTPRLELRPDDDVGLLELFEVALEGVHAPERMPFYVPWTDLPPDELGPRMLQYYWNERAQLTPDRWSVNFLIRHEGRVIGVQNVSSERFAISRVVQSGSWIGMRHQGHGRGTEARAAMLCFVFDHLGAAQARSAAFTDNDASRRVSEKLGYRRDGTAEYAVRGKKVIAVRQLVMRDEFVRPDWILQVEGAGACMPALVAPPARPEEEAEDIALRHPRRGS